MTRTAQEEFDRDIIASTNWQAEDAGPIQQLVNPSESACRLKISIRPNAPDVGPVDYDGTTAFVEIDPNSHMVGGGWCSIHYGKFLRPCKHVIKALSHKGWPTYRLDYFHPRWHVPKDKPHWKESFTRVDRHDASEVAGIDLTKLAKEAAGSDEEDDGDGEGGSTSFTTGNDDDEPAVLGSSTVRSSTSNVRQGTLVGGIPDPGIRSHTGRYSNVLDNCKKIAELSGKNGAVYRLMFPVTKTLLSMIESQTDDDTAILPSNFNFDSLRRLIDLTELQTRSLPKQVPYYGQSRSQAGPSDADHASNLPDTVSLVASSFQEPRQTISSGRKVVKRMRRKQEGGKMNPCSICGAKAAHDKRNCPEVHSLGQRGAQLPVEDLDFPRAARNRRSRPVEVQGCHSLGEEAG